MTNVLVIHPGRAEDRQRLALRERERLGGRDVRLILADDSIVDADRTAFDELVELPPAEQVSASLRAIERFASERAIDAVLSQSESSLLIGALACRSLELPGIRVPAAHLCVNKLRCRVELERAGVGVPKFRRVHDAADVRAFAREVGYPIVLKGVASALSRLVTLVSSAAEIDSAVDRVKSGIRDSLDIQRLCDFASESGVELGCDPRAEFLAEAFAHGGAVETDGIVARSTPISFGVTEQVLSAAPLFFLEGYLLPADRPRGELDAIERTSNAALAALGVDDTGYSIEMRIDGGAVSVIEVNGRLGWDEGFGEMFERGIGVHPMLATLDVALGERPALAIRSGAHRALAYASCYEDAIVARVPSPEQLESLRTPEVEFGVEIGLATYVGARMHAPPHPDAAPHLAFALVDDATSSRGAFARARDIVRRLEFDVRSLSATPARTP